MQGQDRKFVFFSVFLFFSSLVGCLDGKTNDEPFGIGECNDEKASFDEAYERLVVEYVYNFVEEMPSNSYQLHMDSDGAFMENSWVDNSSRYIYPVGVCDFEILETFDTGTCVANANSIMNVHVSYKLGWKIANAGYSIEEKEEYYAVARSNYNSEKWGLFPERGFPVSYDCNFNFQENLGRETDTDGDGLSDLVETQVYKTDAADSDTDGDGLGDYEELFRYYTDPLSIDTDGDGLSDYFEIKRPDVYDNVSMPIVFREGLVGYWSFDEDDGAHIPDKSGNGNEGSFSGGLSQPIWIEGKKGNALKFDGADDKIVIANSDSLNISSSLTIQFWIKLSSQAETESNTAEMAIVEKYDGDGRGYGLYIHESNFSFGVDNSHSKCQSTEWDVFEDWHHVVAVHDLLETNIFVDGESCTSMELWDNFEHVMSGNAPFTIGEPPHNSDKSFNGAIDDLAIWNRALSIEEIWDIYDLDSGKRSLALNPLLADTDGDGLNDGEEVNVIGGNALDYSGDYDQDGISDSMEVLIYNTNPNNPDSDNDGLSDYIEVVILSSNIFQFWNTIWQDEYNFALWNTDPNNPDTDGDGLNDGMEVYYSKNDGEIHYVTNPVRKDSDFDGLTDFDELNTYYTNPNDSDTDGDNVEDGTEIIIDDTDPNDGLSHLTVAREDSDFDGIEDDLEINLYYTNPENKDSDGDGVLDYDELFTYYTNPQNNDSDGDGLSDSFEISGLAQEGMNLHPTFVNYASELIDSDYYWLFDEGGGTTVFDGGDHGNHGNLIDDSMWVHGFHQIYGSALEFDGVDDVVTMTNNPLSGSSGTVAFWMKPNSVNTNSIQVLIGGFFGDDIRSPTIAITNDGKLMWELCGSQNNELNFTFHEDTWYHVVLSFSGSAISVYIDGDSIEPSENTVYGSSCDWSDSDFQIGAYNYMGNLNYFFDGTIDDFLVWNRTLEHGERAEMDRSYLNFGSEKLDPMNADTDSDGLSDYDEITLFQTNPFPIYDNTCEVIIAKLRYDCQDSDMDRISDNIEFFVYKTDMNNPDSDGDGIDDYDEIFRYYSNPFLNDTDNDGLSDSLESEDRYASIIQTYHNYHLQSNYGYFMEKQNYLSSNTCKATLYQHSGFTGWNFTFTTGAYNNLVLPSNNVAAIIVDSGCQISVYDETGFSGEVVTLYGGKHDYFLSSYNHYIQVSSLIVSSDSIEDEGVLETAAWGSTSYNIAETAFAEYNKRIVSDSDKDGLDDGYEILVLHSSPLYFDSDGDGLSDGEEFYIYSTNPSKLDTDDDGIDDRTEIEKYGTDPVGNTDPKVFYKSDIGLHWFSISSFYIEDNDGDGIQNSDDNCHNNYNPSQEDSDYDGVGNECDSTPDAQGPNAPAGGWPSGGGYSSGGGNSNCYTVVISGEYYIWVTDTCDSGEGGVILRHT